MSNLRNCCVRFSKHAHTYIHKYLTTSAANMHKYAGRCTFRNDCAVENSRVRTDPCNTRVSLCRCRSRCVPSISLPRSPPRASLALFDSYCCPSRAIGATTSRLIFRAVPTKIPSIYSSSFLNLFF